MNGNPGLRRSEPVGHGGDPAAPSTGVVVLGEIRFYREGIAHLLRSASDIRVLAVVADWHEAQRPLRTLHPDILLLDMATAGSLEIVRAVRALEPSPKVVALAVPDAEEDVLLCAAAGVSGYVTRDDSFDTLLAAVRSVAQGELLCTPRIAARLFERITALSAASYPSDSYRLTPREQQIARLIADELPNKAIAQRLGIELPTVKNHIHSIFEKLQVHRRRDAVARLRGAGELVRSGSCN